MIQLTIIDQSGTSHLLSAQEGQSIMDVAVNNNIAGIIGECGGDMSCGTCHVHVDDAWRERVGGPCNDEADMLEVVDGVTDASRLCCQIKLNAKLDGVVVAVKAY